VLPNFPGASMPAIALAETTSRVRVAVTSTSPPARAVVDSSEDARQAQGPTGDLAIVLGTGRPRRRLVAFRPAA
jgi:hypothetical protein